MRQRYSSNPDYLLMAIVFFIALFGLWMLASASSDLGQIKFNDSYYYLKHQISYGLIVGFLGFFIAYKFNYHRLEKWAIFFLLFSIGLLVLVFSPLGFSAGGAERWIRLGSLTIQPAEIVKLSFIIYLAAWLSAKPERSFSIAGGFLPFLILSGTIAFLLFIQPSTTSVAIIGFTALIMYFLSGARWSYILSAILAGGLTLLLIVYWTPYRRERITAFLNPEINSRGGGYHLNQAFIAIGAGGLWGTGYGQSSTKFNYLPEPIGDSIFAVIAEELGFIGAIGLIAVYFILIYRGFRVAYKSSDLFSKLFSAGFSSLIAIQTFINIGAISGVLPLTGVPLPFISYGGTALAVFLTGAGLLVNASRHI